MTEKQLIGFRKIAAAYDKQTRGVNALRKAAGLFDFLRSKQDRDWYGQDYLENPQAIYDRTTSGIERQKRELAYDIADTGEALNGKKWYQPSWKTPLHGGMLLGPTGFLTGLGIYGVGKAVDAVFRPSRRRSYEQNMERLKALQAGGGQGNSNQKTLTSL